MPHMSGDYRKYLFILPILLLPRSSWPITECTPLIGSCEYYQCRSKHSQCDEDNYFLKFGFKYCHKFQDKTRSKLSDQGQLWLEKVKICLQQELDLIDEVNLDKGQSRCDNTEQAAIETHYPCYIPTGYCQLSLSDKRVVHRTALFNIWRPRYLRAALKILSACHRD